MERQELLSVNNSDAKECRLFVGGKKVEIHSVSTKVLAKEFAFDVELILMSFNFLHYLKAWYGFLVSLLNLISFFTFYLVSSWWDVLWNLSKISI